MNFDSSRTFHASQAMQLSELISLKFAAQRLGKTPTRLVRVSEPDGPSTDGGRKARQSMLLVPEEGEGNALLFGFLDVGKRAAEIRSYASLKQQYEARFGGTLDVTDEEYGKLLGAMRDFLTTQNVSFELVDAPPPSARNQAGGSSAAPLPRGSSGTRPRGPSAVMTPPKLESGFPVVHVGISFLCGLAVGFVVCWAMMRG